MHQGEVIIEARGLWKSFDRGRIPVIQGASLQIHRGEMVALWGTSGSGKSTLLHLLSGLDVADSGTVTICGMDAKIEANRLRLRRQHLGFVFQLHHLIPDLTLEENLRLPALAPTRTPKKRRRASASSRRKWVSRIAGGIAFKISPAANGSGRPSAGR